MAGINQKPVSEPRSDAEIIGPGVHACDMKSDDSKNWLSAYFPTGALHNNYIVSCGGRARSDFEPRSWCHKIKMDAWDAKWEKDKSLPESRAHSESFITTSNEMWVMGGIDKDGNVTNKTFVRSSPELDWKPGLDLPSREYFSLFRIQWMAFLLIALSKFCSAFAYGKPEWGTFILGGLTDKENATKKVWHLSDNETNWIEGVPMLHPRYQCMYTLIWSGSQSLLADPATAV